MMSSGSTPEALPLEPKVERVLVNGKRVYAHAFKLGLVQRCLEPGTSVAGLALAHGVNANLLRKWITKHRSELGAAPSPALLPVVIDGTSPNLAHRRVRPSCEPRVATQPSSCIEVEVHSARLILRGEIDARQLSIVLDALAARR